MTRKLGQRINKAAVGCTWYTSVLISLPHISQQFAKLLTRWQLATLISPSKLFYLKLTVNNLPIFTPLLPAFQNWPPVCAESTHLCIEYLLETQDKALSAASCERATRANDSVPRRGATRPVRHSISRHSGDARISLREGDAFKWLHGNANYIRRPKAHYSTADCRR